MRQLPQNAKQTKYANMLQCRLKMYIFGVNYARFYKI